MCRTTDSPGRQRNDPFQLPHTFEWRIHPEQLKIAKRPDGRDWKLGAGGFGTVRAVCPQSAGAFKCRLPQTATQEQRWQAQLMSAGVLGSLSIFCACEALHNAVCCRALDQHALV